MIGRTLNAVRATGRALASAFVDLPFRQYLDDPFLARPLRSDVLKPISAKHNPFFAEAIIENFAALNCNGAAPHLHTVGCIEP